MHQWIYKLIRHPLEVNVTEYHRIVCWLLALLSHLSINHYSEGPGYGLLLACPTSVAIGKLVSPYLAEHSIESVQVYPIKAIAIRLRLTSFQVPNSSLFCGVPNEFVGPAGCPLGVPTMQYSANAHAIGYIVWLYRYIYVLAYIGYINTKTISRLPDCPSIDKT